MFIELHPIQRDGPQDALAAVVVDTHGLALGKDFEGRTTVTTATWHGYVTESYDNVKAMLMQSPSIVNANAGREMLIRKNLALGFTQEQSESLVDNGFVDMPVAVKDKPIYAVFTELPMGLRFRFRDGYWSQFVYTKVTEFAAKRDGVHTPERLSDAQLKWKIDVLPKEHA